MSLHSFPREPKSALRMEGAIIADGEGIAADLEDSRKTRQGRRKEEYIRGQMTSEEGSFEVFSLQS